MVRNNLIRSSLFAALALTACAVDEDTNTVDVPAASSLGIARFSLEDTVNTTTITGFDALGNEVGRLELVHGVFDVAPSFADDYPGEARIDGRSIHVFMHGASRFTYQTKGYEPLMHMPAHPGGQEDLAAFLSDPHVKAVLDRWQLGWESSADDDGEVSYVNNTDTITGNANYYWTGGAYRGTALLTSPYRYGQPRTLGGVPLDANTCNGSGLPPTMAIRADRMRRDTSGNLIGDGSKEWIITQVCTEGGVPKFGRKSCSLVNEDSRSRCSASTSTSGCANCGSYDGAGAYPADLTGQPYGMNVDSDNATLHYCWGSSDTRTLSLKVVSNNWFGTIIVDGYPAPYIQAYHTTSQTTLTMCLNSQPYLQTSTSGGYNLSEDFPGITQPSQFQSTQATGLMDANHYFWVTTL